MTRVLCAVSIIPLITLLAACSRTTPTATPTPISSAAISTATYAPTPAAILGPTLPAWTRPADGMVMVYVSGVTFAMGSGTGEYDEQPVHRVILSDFWIDRTEVTAAQFARFLNQQGNLEIGGAPWLDLGGERCPIEYIDGQYRPKDGSASHPVVHITWHGAVAYCAWASARLPTEAEWEGAASGIDGRTHPWGDAALDCDKAQYRDCPGDTLPVGGRPAGVTPYGALDMLGNVAEWVADWHASDYYDRSAVRNPAGPAFGQHRVQRGGSWRDTASQLRGTSRDWSDPWETTGTVGFRCARDADGQDAMATVRSQVLRLRAGPGPTYRQTGWLVGDDRVEIVGRNPAGTWVKVKAPDGIEGWASLTDVKVAASVSGIRVVEIPDPLTPTSASSVPSSTQTSDASASGLTWIRPADQMVMVHVPEGTFLMGSDDEDVRYALDRCRRVHTDCPQERFEDEQPAHPVQLGIFWIDQTEVTNDQYRRCVDADVCQPPMSCIWGEPTYWDLSKAKYPVVCVSWEDADTYCTWAEARLPTEAEWEYAARGPHGHRYPWGEAFDGVRANYCDASCEHDWGDAAYSDAYERTAPAGTYPAGASWRGALGMGGNVWEWTSSLYRSYPYGWDDGREDLNATGERVIRGGSWSCDPNNLRGTARESADRHYKSWHVGFRCAKSDE